MCFGVEKACCRRHRSSWGIWRAPLPSAQIHVFPVDLSLHSCCRGVTGPKNGVYIYIHICLYSKLLNAPLESHDWGHDLVTSGLCRSKGSGRPVIEPLAFETSSAFGYFMIRRRRKKRRRMMRRIPCTPHI